MLFAVGCGGRVADAAAGERTLAETPLAPRLAGVVAPAAPSGPGADAEEEADLSLLPRTPPELARSSPAPSAPASPSPPATCACAAVEVSCEKPKSGYASSDRAACRVTLPRSSCDAIGLVDDATVETSTLLAVAGPAATLAEGASPTEIYARCAVAHEARHVCDGPALRVCETEQRAFDTSVGCFRAFQAAHCEGPSAPPVCAWVARYEEAAARARDLNACLCAPSSTCTSCTAACEAGQGEDLRDFCRVAAAAYCPASGK